MDLAMLKGIVEACESGEYQAVAIDHKIFHAIAQAKGLDPRRGLEIGRCRVVPCFYLVPGAKGEV